MELEKVISCVECGGRAHLLSHRPEDDPFEPGDVIAYTCEDCGHRLDVVVDEVEDENEVLGG